MSYTEDTPPSADVPTTSTESKTLDRYELLNVQLNFTGGVKSAAGLTVTYGRGYDDQGSYVQVDQVTVNVPTNIALDKIDDMPDAAKNIRDNLIEACWNALRVHGAVGSGTYTP